MFCGFLLSVSSALAVLLILLMVRDPGEELPELSMQLISEMLSNLSEMDPCGSTAPRHVQPCSIFRAARSSPYLISKNGCKLCAGDAQQLVHHWPHCH